MFKSVTYFTPTCILKPSISITKNITIENIREYLLIVMIN